MNIRKIAFVLGTLAAAMKLLWATGGGAVTGWSGIVLHNWQEFGLFKLHGSLVWNAGGFGATTNPEIYPGMSPFYLYPIYFCVQLFAFSGLDTLPFFILLAILVFWGIWHLLGRDTLALMVASLALLAPGYGRWQVNLDPNGISVWLGIPYGAAVLYLLRRERIGFREGAALAAMTLLYIPLNWSTAWFLAPFGIFLLLHPHLRRRPVLIYLTLTALASLVFVLGSVRNKAGEAGVILGSNQAHHNLLGIYTWGNYGYYDGLSTVPFFMRLFFVLVVSILPLIVCWLWLTAKRVRENPCRGWLVAGPPLAALAVFAVMRNYFCHHPWMAAPVATAGIVLSLALPAVPEKVARKPLNLAWMTGIALAAFIYGVAIVAIYRTNIRNQANLNQLVRTHVPRSEGVAVIKASDPALLAVSDILGHSLDRRVVMVDTLKDVPHDVPFTILSSHPLDGLPLVADSEARTTGGLAEKATDWFKRKISRRPKNDQREYLDHYYLYRPAP